MSQVEFSPVRLPRMELIPPREAEIEGIYRGAGPYNGRPIYTEVMLDVPATKASARVKLDEDGNEVWKKNQQTGEAMYPILVKEIKYTTRRYVLQGVDHGPRKVKRNYNFEPTTEELDELARRDAEKDFLTSFVKAALDEGMTPASVLAKIRDQVSDPNEAEDQVELSVTEEVIAETIAELDGDMMSIDREEVAFVIDDEDEPAH